MKKLFLLLLAASALCSFKGNDTKGQVTLYVDAGHGGEDAGGISSKGDKESEICLELAKAVARKGEERNVHVVLIRDNDEYVKLMDRSAKTKDAPTNSYFVSLHLDASGKEGESGILVIMDPSTQVEGAINFHRKVIRSFSRLGVVKGETKRLAVLRNSTIPAVMVSPGYITSDADMVKVKSKSYQEQVADVLINAVTMK